MNIDTKPICAEYMIPEDIKSKVPIHTLKQAGQDIKSHTHLTHLHHFS